MKKIWIFILFSVIACSKPETIVQEDMLKGLKFNADRTFKIAQFTDLHIDLPSSTTEQTINTIEHVLITESPDFSILTGDIINSVPAREGWIAIAEVFEKNGFKWTVTLGNHDDEGDMTREEIFTLLKTMTQFKGIKGPDISGVGNFILPILSSDSESAEALLYIIDSHGYPPKDKPGVYDWIKFDQIEWYRRRSIEFTHNNDSVPLPALAFFHNPLPEFDEVVGQETTIGLKEEKVCAPYINSGLFASMIEMGDVMGVFVGHDHVNNYIGILYNIALGYGQITGARGYGDFERGARIIELKQGQRNFNTWITTASGESLHYNYPSGSSFR